MPNRWDDFLAFQQAVEGKRLLHLGHKDADCDALGSAYAMSRVMPGAVGFAGELKTSAQDLANWLGLDAIANPDPADFDYTIVYDTLSPGLLGLPLPSRYALFDHHEPGGHRNSEFHSLLAEGAEWAWVKPFDSTCSLVWELFHAHAITVDERMAIALASGLLTDTGMLLHADAATLGRLAALLELTGMYLEDVQAVVDNPLRKASFRPAVLQALNRLREEPVNGWGILVTETASREHAFVVLNLLNHLGSDVRVVGFPINGRSMVFSECRQALVEQAGLDLCGLMGRLAQPLSGAESWGTRSLGRIVAHMPVGELTEQCVQAVREKLLAQVG